mmetsp:Transcript_27979/g.59676  ORF Transcript_27979/g.59676 Transcript_27979/m.59676 type:complete len:153 (-) Transcript_27979:457-915(-)
MGDCATSTASSSSRACIIVQRLVRKAARAMTKLVEVSIDISSRTSIISASGDVSSSSHGERLKNGECILQLENLADEEECKYLCDICSKLNASPTCLEKAGHLRLPTIAVTNTPCADPLPVEVDELLQIILLRAMRIIDEQIWWRTAYYIVR